jgi:sec-independent protein translocase protein TatA
VVEWEQLLSISSIEKGVAMTYGGLFAFGPFASPTALVVLGIVAVLLFGNRLPSVMRSLGRSVVEFKKGVAGIEDDIDDAVRSADDKVKAEKRDAEV